eukprot:111690-Alexandrium_andersonii.AAC.1
MRSAIRSASAERESAPPRAEPAQCNAIRSSMDGAIPRWPRPAPTKQPELRTARTRRGAAQRSRTRDSLDRA